MLRLIIACVFALLHSYSNAQNEAAAARPDPPKPALTASTPMPRVNEPFMVSIDISKLRENIYKSVSAKIKNAKVTNNGSTALQLLSIIPEKTGPLEIAPIKYVVNKKKYTTNKLVVQVVEALPETDTGLWFSKVPINNEAFYIIIEQRAPIKEVTTTLDNGTRHTSFVSSLQHDYIVKYNHNAITKGLMSNGTSATTGHKTTNKKNGDKLEYLGAYTVARFRITDPKAEIKLTREHFVNLPVGYVFNDIIVQ